MKLFHITLLLFSVLLLNGCIGEDMDSCPEVVDNNLSITFLYPDDAGKDIFSKKIDKVDLFVFDEQGHFVTSQTIEQAALSAFAGAKLKLSPGTYRIVCWGNASTKSEFGGVSNGSLFTDAFISNSTVDGNSVATNGDRLYYAPASTTGQSLSQGFTITVPTEGMINKSINFSRAHIRVIVYTKGFEDHSQQGASLTPVIELTNVSLRYNFNMQTSANLITYRDISVSAIVEGKSMNIVDFNTPLFDENTSMQMVIKKQSDGSTLTTVNLADFIRDNNITIDDSVEIVVPILIEYIGGSFQITLSKWGQTPVGPEL